MCIQFNNKNKKKMMQMIKSDKQLGLNFNQHTELYDILISKNNF